MEEWSERVDKFAKIRSDTTRDTIKFVSNGFQVEVVEGLVEIMWWTQYNVLIKGAADVRKACMRKWGK